MTMTALDAWCFARGTNIALKDLLSALEADPSLLDTETREELTAAREALDRLLACVPVERNAA